MEMENIKYWDLHIELRKAQDHFCQPTPMELWHSNCIKMLRDCRQYFLDELTVQCHYACAYLLDGNMNTMEQFKDTISL